MKIHGFHAAMAAALAACLAASDTATAQGKRDQKVQQGRGQGKQAVRQGGNQRGNPGNKQVGRQGNRPPAGQTNVPRGGQANNPRGRQGNNQGRNIFQPGRRWTGQGVGANRGTFYRQRSQSLGTQLRIGIGGIRIGVGTRGGNNRYQNDWQRWNSDNYARHNWRSGSWQGDWYGSYDSRWRQSWRRYPAVLSFGTTRYGMNRMGYWFGYNTYYNPYYSQGVVVGAANVDYSQPLVAAPPEYDDSNTTLTEFDQARDAFKQRQYDNSLALVNQAIAKQPRDATLHEFLALVLFAKGNYHAAAATLNPVLAVGPGWDWATLRGLYSSVADYTTHVRALESFVNENDKLPYGHFLLGYQYLTMGHTDAARKQLSRAVALSPKDGVSQQLLSMLDKDAPIDAPPIAQADQSSKVTSAALMGNWSAKRGDADFRLKLNKDMSFEWNHREGKNNTSITGTYAYDNGTLALEPQKGGVMLATIVVKANNRMQFTMVGSDAKDSGLMFSK